MADESPANMPCGGDFARGFPAAGNGRAPCAGRAAALTFA